MFHLFLYLITAFTKNRRVYFEVAVNGNNKTEALGRIEFELFDDKVPKTAENFYHLCINKAYKNTTFYSIKSISKIEGGRGANLKDCNCKGLHGGYGEYEKSNGGIKGHFLLSTANDFLNSNSTCFFIHITAFPRIYGKDVLFGKVTYGRDIILRIESSCCKTMGQQVLITDCGKLEEDS